MNPNQNERLCFTSIRVGTPTPYEDVFVKLANGMLGVGYCDAYGYWEPSTAILLATDKRSLYFTADVVSWCSLQVAQQAALDDDCLINQIIRDVAELPDRTSPDDWPEALLVTATELRKILASYIDKQSMVPAILEPHGWAIMNQETGNSIFWSTDWEQVKAKEIELGIKAQRQYIEKLAKAKERNILVNLEN